MGWCARGVPGHGRDRDRARHRHQSPAGSPVEVIDGRHHVTLSAALLAQPRLVTDGDARGGRYVSGVVDIYVGTGPAR